jgi:hypothetical protein
VATAPLEELLLTDGLEPLHAARMPSTAQQTLRASIIFML